MPLVHVHVNFVANYYGEKAKKAPHLGCCNTKKAAIDYNEILLLHVLCTPSTTWYYMYTKHHVSNVCMFVLQEKVCTKNA